MKNTLAIISAAGLLFVAATHLSARAPQASPPASKPVPQPAPVVAPDLAERLAKFKLVRMPFHAKGLSAREIKMVDKLVDAAGLSDCIYWRQTDPKA